MTYKVRDEDDVLEANLRYHLARGVDFFVVTDNGSQDGTRELLARYEGAGLARVIDEPADEMRSHGHEWLTTMARLAATEHEADWVLHNDADEFWWPLEGSLRDALASIPDSYGAMFAPRVEFVGRPDGPGTFAERLTVREAQGRLRPKVAHRARADVAVLHRGGHDVAVVPESGNVRDSLRPPGRAVLRAGRARPAGDEGMTPAPVWPIRILHFPLRSFDQYRHRVELGLASFSADQGAWARLHQARERGELESLYAELVHDDAAVAEGLEAGELTEDPRVRDYLALCPDPLTQEARIVDAPAPAPGSLAAEREAVARDAMATLSRYGRLFEVRLGESRRRITQLVEKSSGKAELAKLYRAERRKVKRQKDKFEALQTKLRRMRARRNQLKRQLAAERSRPPLVRLRRWVGRFMGRGRKS